MKKFLIFTLFISLAYNTTAQKTGKSFLPAITNATPSYITLLHADTINWLQVQAAYENYYTTHLFVKNEYTQYYKRWMQSNKYNMQADGTLQMPTDFIETPIKKLRGPNSEWQVMGPLQTFSINSTSSPQVAVPTQVNIYAFDVAPSNANILYAAPESGGIFKSINKGLNWVSVTDTINMFNITAIAIHPTNPDIAYAGGQDKVYKTINGGGSWTSILSLPNLGTHDIAIVPSSPNTILLASDAGLQISTNGGATWSIVSGMASAVYDVEINQLNNNSIYALKKNTVSNQTEFYKSHNMGVSFAQVSTGWIAGTDYAGRLAITTADTNRIYAVLLMITPTAAPAIMRSNNGGASWATAVQSTVLGLSGDASAPIGMSHGQGFYDLSIMANNNNADEVIVGTTSIYKSTDGASTFTRIGGYGGSFNLHPDIQEAKMLGNDAWISTDGGIIYSSDFFTATTNYSTRLNGIYGSAYWGFGQGWNEDITCGGRYHNGNDAMYEMYPAGSSIALGGGESGTGFALPGKSRHVVHSDIGGKVIPSTLTAMDNSNFTFSKYPNEDAYGFDAGEMEFQNDCYNNIYITKDSSLWKSIDGGASFTSIYKFTARTRKFEISRSSPNVIYLATGTGLYKSADTGTTFTQITLPTGVNASNTQIALSHSDANIFWITGRNNSSNNKVFKSIDGGTTFINLTNTTINAYKFYSIVHHAGSDGGVYIFSENTGKVFYTNNTLGTNWYDFSKKLPKIFDPVGAKIFYRDNKLRAAGSRGIWQIDLYEDAPPLAQPTVDKLTSYCAKDTFYFDDYSTLKHTNATWQWNFIGATYVSNTNARNPKVIFPNLGTYTATLTVTNAIGQASTKAISVNILGNECAVDTIIGNAIQVIGQNRFASTNNINVPNVAAFTMMAWIKGAGTQVDYAGIFGINIGNNNNVHLNVRSVGADSTELGYHHPNGAWSYSSGLYLKPNEWTHVALVVEPTQISIYKNGIKATHSGLTLPMVNLGPNLKIGTMITREYDRCFWGKIDEVALYKYALNANEIRDMMHLTKQNPNYATQANASLIAYYQFNENNSNISYNKVGAAHLSLQNITRVPSTAPCGGGVSYRINGINSAGINTFTGTGVDINFAAGTTPNGHVIVNKINALPDATAGSFVAQKSYYIINNYGTNSTFTPLTYMQFNNLNNFGTLAASNFELYKRLTNADGPTWGNVHAIADVYTPNGNTSSLAFNANNNITNFGQFYFASKEDLTPVAITENTKQDFLFSVYPNPAKSNCYLKIVSPTNYAKAFIHITNTAGATVHTSTSELKVGINTILIPLPAIASGNYIVSMQVGNSYTTAQLIIQ